MASRPQASGSGPDGGTTPPGRIARGDLELVVRRAVIDAVTAEVVGAFKQEGIPSILLKGPALVRWLYPLGGERSYSDTDLLVSPGTLSKAERLLARIGFTRAGIETIPGDWPRHARNWIRPEKAVVDLHYTLPGAQASAARVWEVLAERTEQMVVGRLRLDILDSGARAMLVALHAHKDGGRMPQARRDLRLALEQLPKEVWQDAASLASELVAEDAFAAGLERDPVGRTLVGELGLSSRRSTAVTLRVRGAPPLAVGMDWLFGTRGLRRKTALVIRKLFPPPSFLRDWVPLARRGPLGLAAAYVWRPIWVLINAGPALRAWLRARGESRRHPPDAG